MAKTQNNLPPLPPIDAYEDLVDYGQDDVGSPVSDRPVIRLGPEIGDVADQAEILLRDSGQVYQRAGQLVRIVEMQTEVQRIERGVGHVGHLAHTTASLTDLLSRLTRWERYDARARKLIQVAPPKWIAELLEARATWSLPALRGVVTSPTMTVSGEILDRPGYDRETGLYLVHSGRWPTVPRRPTIDDAQHALRDLHEVIRDFPFSSGAGKSAAVAAMLTLAARPAIQGCVPLVAIGARDAGTGKTRLADAISIIGTGLCAPGIAPWTEPEEGRKTLLAVAVAGDRVALLDNWPAGRLLGDQALDQAITRESIRGRILGQSEMISAPWDAMIIVTGNGLIYGGDMIERVMPIDLDAGCEDPRSRTGFTHDPLLPWISHNRKRLLIACLIILRAYHVAGRPSQGLVWGSFENWSDLIRSSLVWAGVDDPCEGRTKLRETCDIHRESLRVLLQRWHDVWGSEWLTSSTIRSRLSGHIGDEMRDLLDAFIDLLPRSTTIPSNKAISKMLMQHLGSVRSGLRIARSAQKDRSNAYYWRVEEV